MCNHILMQNLKKYFLSIFLGVCIIVAVFFVYKLFFNKSTKLPAQPETRVEEVVPPSSEVAIPTKTTEGVRAKGSPNKLITATVDITNTEIVPSSLEVVPFTLVQFNNKSGKAIEIVGEKWGNFSLASGTNKKQLFDRAEKYSYTITGLNASLTGEIIVK